MTINILIAVKRTSKGPAYSVLYAGPDGVALEDAATEAAKSMKFDELHRVTNPQTVRMPIDPRPSTCTKPTFIRPKEIQPVKTGEPPKALKEMEDKARALREQRLKPAQPVPPPPAAPSTVPPANQPPVEPGKIIAGTETNVEKSNETV